MDPKANLTEEEIRTIKEDIKSGLSPKKICMKYHISPVKYAEIKDSMKQKEQSSSDPDRIISPKTYYVRPYVSPYIRRTRNRHWGFDSLYTIRHITRLFYLPGIFRAVKPSSYVDNPGSYYSHCGISIIY